MGGLLVFRRRRGGDLLRLIVSIQGFSGSQIFKKVVWGIL